MPFFWKSKSITPEHRDPFAGDDHASLSFNTPGCNNDALSATSSMKSSTDESSSSSPSLSSSAPSASSTSLPITNSIPSKENAIVSEPWTRIFPEAYGIRKAIEDSPFRWCVRESSLWAVATGTVMGIHRLRMGSRSLFAGKVAFGTAFLVVVPSYYFCYRKREHQEHVIELMMAVNDFRPGEEMPETIPLDKDHPFLDVRDVANGEKGGERDLQKEFVARLKEKKEWQEPYHTQDAEDVFKEVKK